MTKITTVGVESLLPPFHLVVWIRREQRRMQDHRSKVLGRRDIEVETQANRMPNRETRGWGIILFSRVVHLSFLSKPKAETDGVQRDLIHIFLCLTFTHYQTLFLFFFSLWRHHNSSTAVSLFPFLFGNSFLTPDTQRKQIWLQTYDWCTSMMPRNIRCRFSSGFCSARVSWD